MNWTGILMFVGTLSIVSGCVGEKSLNTDGGDNPSLDKITNTSSSSVGGELLLQFSDAADVPSEISVSLDSVCHVSLEPLFAGASDRNLCSWYVARFSSAISSEDVAEALSERKDVSRIQYNKIIVQERVRRNLRKSSRLRKRRCLLLFSMIHILQTSGISSMAATHRYARLLSRVLMSLSRMHGGSLREIRRLLLPSWMVV